MKNTVIKIAFVLAGALTLAANFGCNPTQPPLITTARVAAMCADHDPSLPGYPTVCIGLATEYCGQLAAAHALIADESPLGTHPTVGAGFECVGHGDSCDWAPLEDGYCVTFISWTEVS